MTKAEEKRLTKIANIRHYFRELYEISRSPSPKAGDEPYVRELDLWADNTEHLYNNVEDFDANLAKKIVAGKYNHQLSKKLWMYYADWVAEDYSRNLGGDRTATKAAIPVSVRRDYANLLAHNFAERFIEANLRAKGHDVLVKGTGMSWGEIAAGARG